MTGCVFSPLARGDLGEIWDYTAERWGAEQADRYVRQIAATCNDLAAGRRRGRSMDAVRPGYFKCPAGSHVVFYRPNDAGSVVVVRILHQRMDVDRHL